MLKPVIAFRQFCEQKQPPSGGCVLKPNSSPPLGEDCSQPPSGGCVLKQHADEVAEVVIYAAAFGRLCVETFVYIDNQTSL